MYISSHSSTWSISSITTILLLQISHTPQIQAKSIPSNVQAFYNSVRTAGSCTGSDLLQGGFHDVTDGPTEYGYCQRGVVGKAIYIKGPDTKLANMDVDCDGVQTGLDTRCQASTDTQAQTSFRDEIRQQFGMSDLKADVHPYVVFGNQGGYRPTFDPVGYGVRPLSLVAVVCGDKLVYGVWGDTNGDDGVPLVEEASLALATACYGRDTVGGDNGHDEEDVLYVAFVGDVAVPGVGAMWNASSYEEFEASITSLGDELVASLPSNVSNISTTGNDTTTTTTSSTTTSEALRQYKDVGMICILVAFCTAHLMY